MDTIIKEGFVIQESGGLYIKFDVNGWHCWLDNIDDASLFESNHTERNREEYLDIFGRADKRVVKNVYIRKEIKITKI